jgi:hypothetical protein
MRTAILGITILVGLAACAAEETPDPGAPATPIPAAPAPAATTAPTTPPTGATLHYTRSNSDGSLPERILVHIVSPTELAVAKMVDRCKDAALVTAVFDPAAGEAIRMTGGRLGRDGQQVPQAHLTLVTHPDQTRRIDVRFGDPQGPVAETIPAPPSPWRMYDFDLAEFALFGHRDSSDFAFGLAIAWPDDNPPIVDLLGEAQATLASTDIRDGREVRTYQIGGPALGAAGGPLTLDAAQGYVVEAKFGAPNHPGYTDFHLKLDRIVEGEAAWREDLASHWRDCPA